MNIFIPIIYCLVFYAKLNIFIEHHNSKKKYQANCKKLYDL